MTNRELKALLKVLRAHGAVSFKANGIEILLDPNFVQHAAPTKASSKKIVIESNSLQSQFDKMIPQMSDEDWLLATNMPTEEAEVN